MPTLSIITINLNNETGLQKTIDSILQQSFISYEHIIIDGDSTDRSKEIIQQYSKKSPYLSFWISEKDNGVYNAMNKGILKASGDYLLFLNSGDFLEPEILNHVSGQLSGEDIIYGDLYFCLDNGQRVLEIFPNPPLTSTQLISSTFYLPHPATFIKRTLFNNEKYNEHYKIISDWEFWIKNILFKDCTIKHIPTGISNFASSGLSSNQLLISQEKEDAFSQLFPPKILKSLRALAILEQSPLHEVILKINHTNRFQYKMKGLILFCYKIRNFLTKKEKKRE